MHLPRTSGSAPTLPRVGLEQSSPVGTIFVASANMSGSGCHTCRHSAHQWLVSCGLKRLRDGHFEAGLEGRVCTTRRQRALQFCADILDDLPGLHSRLVLTLFAGAMFDGWCWTGRGGSRGRRWVSLWCVLGSAKSRSLPSETIFVALAPLDPQTEGSTFFSKWVSDFVLRAGRHLGTDADPSAPRGTPSSPWVF